MLQVVAKDCSHAELVREVLCNRLALMLGLPVPNSFVVDTHNSSWPCQQRFTYATELQGNYRSYSLTLRDSRITRDFLQAWPFLEKAILFDEWIANSDRTPANLLFDSQSTFMLIDHGETLPQALHPATHTSANYLASHLLSTRSAKLKSGQSLTDLMSPALDKFKELDLTKLEFSTPEGSWTPGDELN